MVNSDPFSALPLVIFKSGTGSTYIKWTRSKLDPLSKYKHAHHWSPPPPNCGVSAPVPIFPEPHFLPSLHKYTGNQLRACAQRHIMSKCNSAIFLCNVNCNDCSVYIKIKSFAFFRVYCILSIFSDREPTIMETERVFYIWPSGGVLSAAARASICSWALSLLYLYFNAL